MGIKLAYIIKFIAAVCALIFYCEFLVYYLVLIQCSWPKLNPSTVDKTIPMKTENQPVKAMIIADTHLLGSRNGHWFDKLRREWQMYRAFQTALTIHNPDVVFVLGDLFDEGLWCSEREFSYYVSRFQSLFEVPDTTDLFVVVGNHDIGFHYGISPYLHERFSNAFDASSVRLISISGNHFVLLNSMALEGDGCFLCRPAELQLSRISARLRCTKGISRCEKDMNLGQYSRPILLQHFPMFRESDESCRGSDSAPQELKADKFRERWDCLSREASDTLIDQLWPRLVVSGHTHHGCTTSHRKGAVAEWTLPSFSWRNKDNPTFMMAVVTPNNYAGMRCHVPVESTIISTYILGGMLITLWLIFSQRRRCRRFYYSKSN
ncbi:metallophosphoesterase 1 [Hetaerina americana]|uniref:metallophosphoesterase 1 n=1 Tax=Hetaerina americana TaxID=62018 RepID=UPI003A7F1794